VPTTVETYVRSCIDANNDSRIAAGNERRRDQVAALRLALHWLLAALALDPTRSDPVWANQPPQDAEALTDRQIRFYEFIVGRADAGQY